MTDRSQVIPAAPSVSYTDGRCSREPYPDLSNSLNLTFIYIKLCVINADELPDLFNSNVKYNFPFCSSPLLPFLILFFCTDNEFSLVSNTHSVAVRAMRLPWLLAICKRNPPTGHLDGQFSVRLTQRAIQVEK